MQKVVTLPSPTQAASSDRNVRIRKRLFKDPDSFVFSRSRGFVPFPILMRRLLKHLKHKQLELLCYLWLRSDVNFLCYPPLEEITEELGQQSLSRLKATIRDLEQLNLIRTAKSKGRTYFLVGDPRHGLARLHEKGLIGEQDIDEANELLAQLRLPEIVLPPAGKKVQQP